MRFSRSSETARHSDTWRRVKVRVVSGVSIACEDEDKGSRVDVGEVSVGKSASA